MPRRLQLAVFLIVYCCVLSLLPNRSFWLDEVIHLIGARDRTVDQIPAYAAQSAGGVPLGFLYTRTSIRTLGYSQFSARLPSILFSAGACAAVFVLALRLGLRYPMLAVLVFVGLPLQFRYALEVRPYSAVLCIAGWSTIAFLRMVDRPQIPRALLYSALLLVGLYTQPYSFLVALAHFGWLALNWRKTGSRVLIVTGSSVGLSALLFLPWMQFATSQWRAEIASYAAQGGFGPKEVQLIVKELVGFGYLGTLLIAVPAFLGWRALDPERRSLWALLIAIPILGAIAGNLAFGYFFASRQFIWVLVPLSILAARGFENAHWVAARCWAVALVAASLYADVQAFRRPREDWEAAASAITAKLAESRGCLMLAPPRSLDMYLFFEPALKESLCGTALDPARPVVLAYSPYESAASYRSATERLQSESWKAIGEQVFHGPKIIFFRRE